jgi:hypothetical protein
MKKNHPQIVIESPNSKATTLDTVQMGNTAAISQTSKSGLTRKMNNAFRKHLIEFEKGVLEAKIEQIKPEKWQEISEELCDIQCDFENRMQEAEDEARVEMTQRLQSLMGVEDVEVVAAVAASDVSEARYVASFDIEAAIEDNPTEAFTHLEEVKTAPIAELKEKYSSVYEEWQAEMNKPLGERFGIAFEAESKPASAPTHMHAVIAEQKKMAAAVECNKPQSEPKCGVCGRLWVEGKCSGGFVNHRL